MNEPINAPRLMCGRDQGSRVGRNKGKSMRLQMINTWIAFEKRSYSGGCIGIPTETSQGPRSASFLIGDEVFK